MHPIRVKADRLSGGQTQRIERPAMEGGAGTRPHGSVVINCRGAEKAFAPDKGESRPFVRRTNAAD